jgi:hypothetical protein
MSTEYASPKRVQSTEILPQMGRWDAGMTVLAGHGAQLLAEGGRDLTKESV